MKSLIGMLLFLALAPFGQDVTKAIKLLEEALEALKPPPTPVEISTPEAFDQAIAAGNPVIALTTSFVYTKSLTLTKPVTIQSKVPEGRMKPDTPLPKFTGSIRVEANDVILQGIEVTNVGSTADILLLLGARNTVDRIRVRGNDTTGSKRCIAANTEGAGKIVQSHISNCFLPSPGADSQAIGGWSMRPGLLIEDNYLEGGSETILFGGADSAIDRTPTDITIRGNTITKNPAWFGQPIGVKNLVEFKNAKNVLFENNDCSYSWVQGQVGYLLVLTIRNQDGRAPWATLQDLVFRGNTWRDGVGAVNILGRDDIKESIVGRPVPIGTVRESIPMARVSIQNDTFLLDPVKYNGGTNTKSIMISGGPSDLTITNVTIKSASKVGSSMYLSSSPSNAPVTNFTFTTNTVPVSTYGLFGAGTTATPTNWTSTNPSWIRWTRDSTISGVTVVPLTP